MYDVYLKQEKTKKEVQQLIKDGGQKAANIMC